jgi:hypothetical protein
MSHTNEIKARVGRFTPRSLTGAEWALARPAVTTAVVAAEPSSVEQARLLASRLCAFLAWLPAGDWDRACAPDLAAVLTDGRIRLFASPAGMPRSRKSSRDRVRVALRRCARGLPGPGPVRGGRAAIAPAVARAFWPAVAGTGPFTVLAAAYRASGESMHGNAWAGIAADLSIDMSSLPVAVPAAARPAAVSNAVASNARPGGPGTVLAVQVAAALLRDAKAPASGVVPASTKKHETQPAARVERPVSRAAAIRAARAAQAGRAALADAGPVAAVPALPGDLAGMLVGWTPQGMDAGRWAMVEAAVVAAVAAYQPASAGSLRNVRSTVVAFAGWLQQRPGRTVGSALDAREFLADGVIDAYLAGPMLGEPGPSRATVRSVLRRVVRNLGPGPKPEAIRYQPVQGPYTGAQCARLVALARNQPTVALRRSLSAMVALGLGAGLGAEDQRAIAPCHVREVDLGVHGTALAVDVPGTRARTVVVRAEVEPLLREALDAHALARRGNATPLHGVKPDRRNGANRVAARAVTATGTGVDVDAARLRATWLVACMSAPVPLGALLHAAGLRTPRTLADLLAHCPPPDPLAVAAVLHATGSEVAS